MNTHPLLSKKLRYGLVGSLALFSLSAFGQSTWNVNTNGSWEVAGNWSPSGSPSGVGVVVNFGSIITANRTVSMSSAHTVGTINFNDNNDYTLDSNSATNRNLTFDVTSGNAQINVTGGNGSHNMQEGINLILNDNLVINHTTTGVFTIYGDISGVGGITKNGSGFTIIRRTISTQVNTFTGNTIVNAGTLQIGIGDNAIILGTGNVTINTGGTLLHSGNNKINDAADIFLNGGTWNLGNDTNEDTVATLTLSASSVLDMGTGAGANVLTFTGGATYTAGLLTIDNWSGILDVGGGIDQIVFGSPVSQSFLNNIYWSAQNITGARQLANGEIVPVPEASSVLAGIGLAAAAVGYEIRRRKAKGVVLS